MLGRMVDGDGKEGRQRTKVWAGLVGFQGVNGICGFEADACSIEPVRYFFITSQQRTLTRASYSYVHLRVHLQLGALQLYSNRP